MRCKSVCNVPLALAMVLSPLLAGCSSNKPPERFADGVAWVAERHHVRDAKTQRVKGMSCLRFDAALIDRLNAAIGQEDLAKAKAESLAVVEGAHALARTSTANELGRLDDAGWRELSRIYFGGPEVAPSQDLKDALADAYRRETDLQVWFLKRRIEQSPDVAALRAVLTPIRGQTETSVKGAGGLGRAGALAVLAMPAAVARETIHDKEATCQPDAPFATSVHYIPPDSPGGAPAIEHWDLLVRHAPVFVQERAPDARYAPSADELGTVLVNDDQSVTIDTTRPAVYGYTRTVLLGGKPHVQLVYATWYPERPRLKAGLDAEAGKVDGATIRITLDAELRPAVFETLNNCGCHHRLYPSAALEAAAGREFGAPEPGKSFGVEHDVKGKYDVIIPKAVDPATGPRPLVRCRAGTHAVVDVDYAMGQHSGEQPRERRPYALLPYDDLEQLKTPGGRTVSMFQPDGLVRGAERLEGDLFKPLGMLSAGQPRQRGTQLIQWDQFDFDDPRLLEKTLRLPSRF